MTIRQRRIKRQRRSVKKKLPSKRFNKNLAPALSTKTAKSIIVSIKNWAYNHSTIGIDYTRWYCGITNHPPSRKSQHRAVNEAEPFVWNEWDAKSRRIAEAIETYFHELGMKDKDTKGGSAEDSKYIYVYKKHPTFWD
jgi:hypothetical protein